MTYDEITKEISSVNRTCKGYLTPMSREVINHQFELFTQTGDDSYLEQARLLDVLNRNRLDSTIVTTTTHIDVKGRTIHDMITDLGEVLPQKVSSRCGYNFNEIIISNPWDGAIYEYKCPQCGVQGEFRSPKF